jgi:protein O-GlcNAc transferase
MKKIISYSLWGNEPKYLIGALENMKCKEKLFTDWTCRFYCHVKVDPYYIDQLEKAGAEIVIKNEVPSIKPMDNPGWFWRFEILKDKNVERCISRDCDSRLTQREKNCVIDWERSGKEFHIIRDHVMHGTKIMAGMWGATKSFIDRIDYDDMIKTFSTLVYNNIYATDQEFLARMIYPLIKDTALIHDDWDRFNEGARKIPHIRDAQHFIGEPIKV